LGTEIVTFQVAAPSTRKRFHQFLTSVAVALLVLACIGVSGVGAQAPQPPAQAQSAKSEPEVVPAPEQPRPQPAQSSAAGEVAPGTPGEVAPRAGANTAPTAEKGGNQTVADCASLLKMATELKAEVDKTTKEELSMGVVRKAGDIEQLARKIRKK
jgi:hypothetical protein